MDAIIWYPLGYFLIALVIAHLWGVAVPRSRRTWLKVEYFTYVVAALAIFAIAVDFDKIVAKYEVAWRKGVRDSSRERLHEQAQEFRRWFIPGGSFRWQN